MRQRPLTYLLAVMALSTPAGIAQAEVTFVPRPGAKVEIYGHVHVSVDGVDDYVKTYPQVTSNLSYFGLRASQELFGDVKVVGQIETLVQVAATPNAQSAIGSRNSFVGFESKTLGALKAGKHDTPYKMATAEFDPFSATVGDMNAIVGNSGGDNRVEFDVRAPHAIWYETPRFFGVQMNVMYSPGQNLADDDSNFAQGESLCSGATERSSGSGQAGVPTIPVGGPFFGNVPGQNTSVGSGYGECNDGGNGDIVSANATYRLAGLIVTATTEHHFGVNRTGDEAPPAPPAGALGVHEELGAKMGAGYDFGRVKVYGLFEVLRRVGTQPLYNERSREGWYGSVSWRFLPSTEVMAHYGRATRTPGDPGVIPAGDNAADLYSVGLRHHFGESATLYAVGALDHNHATGHYGLGQSGHGAPILARDLYNEGFHLPNALLGRTMRAVSVGATYSF